MSEEIHYHTDPVEAACNWLGLPGRGYTFNRWITALHYPHLIAGMEGTLDGGVYFVVRHDWDPTKGYHVKVIKGSVRRAYISIPSSPEDRAIQCYNRLTGMVQGQGDAEAQRWFVDPAEWSKMNL